MDEILSVSAIIPTYNRAPLVCMAVESVLAQTHPKVEVIVVDDGSTDDTASRLSKFGDRIRILRQINSGVCTARNNGMAVAKGDFIAFLDSDDLWMPWKIAAQVAAFRAIPELQLTWTDAAVIDLAGNRLSGRCLRSFYHASFSYLPENALFKSVRDLRALAPYLSVPQTSVPLRVGDFSRSIFLGNFFHLSTVMFRRPLLEQYGNFDVAVGNAGEDYEFFSRLAQSGLVGLVDVSAAECRAGGTLSRLRTHSALANLNTLSKIDKMLLGRSHLSPKIVQRRRRDSYAWAGLALFDDDRHREARPYLARAIAMGCLKIRVAAYCILSFFPERAITVLRSLYYVIKPR